MPSNSEMDLHGKRIILGSASPRRRELLAGLDVEFTVDTGNTFEEFVDESVPHCDIPALMSEGKSRGFHRSLEPDEILITADTMVLLGGRLLGKPRDREDAVRMLRELSGREHEVITAVTLRSVDHFETFTDSSLVTFASLTDDEIDYYIDKYRPFDKAGAYGVQEWIGYVAITGIRGSFYNVMGLPVHALYRHLLKLV